jgi:hypothetical protein
MEINDMITRVLVAAVVGLTLVADAAAQTKKGPNGGAVVIADEHPIEFVHRGQDIVFYLSDHDGKPQPTKGLKARAVVQVSGKTATIALSPAAPNLFVGKLATPLGSKAIIVFFSRFEGHALQARFVVD